MDIAVNYKNKRLSTRTDSFVVIDKCDYVDISNENDSFYCRPTGKNVITKRAFATEELYLRSAAALKEAAQ